MAIENHCSGMLSSAVEKIKTSFKLDGRGNDMLSTCAVLPPSLETLALASLWGGYIGIGKNSINIDLLDIGLCSIRAEGAESRKVVYVLDEELAKRAILQVARKYEFSNKAFATGLQLSLETKGHAMEPVLVAELARWSQDQSGCATVRKFLETLFGDLPQDLPSWIDGAIFNVKNASKSTGKRNIKYIADALKIDGHSLGVLLSPSTVKRPDFEAVMGSDDFGRLQRKKCFEIDGGKEHQIHCRRTQN